MTDESSSDTDVPDSVVRKMVRTLRPAWEPQRVERQAHGTDFIAVVELDTPKGLVTSVLKATTASLFGTLTRVEPRMLDLVGNSTDIPVPDVYGYCDEHENFPAPYYLMSHEPGVNLEGEQHMLAPAVQEQVVRDAGRNLAALHSLAPRDAVGTIGVRNGDLTVLDTDENPCYEDDRAYALARGEESVGTLDSGGAFPELADEPDRFGDLMPTLREYLRETAPELPEPAAPTYCHPDYRYGNLLLDEETGTTEAVIDWVWMLSVEPAYNLAITESKLLGEPGTHRTERLRRTFRTAYAERRDIWCFDDDVRERMRFYQFVQRIHAMSNLPLFHRDATASEKAEIEATHREFVTRHISSQGGHCS